MNRRFCNTSTTHYYFEVLCKGNLRTRNLFANYASETDNWLRIENAKEQPHFMG